MKILITGINGFVGRILKEDLLNKDYSVFGMDAAGKGDNFHRVDITDYQSVLDCILSVEPDYIYHLAGISFVNTGDVEMIYDVNTSGTLNVLRASIRLKKMPKFLFVSSSQVYGIVDEVNQPIKENCPVNPVNHYGASKSAGESMVMAYCREYGLPAVIVRSFNHTGKGQYKNFIIPKLVEAFKNHDKILKIGNIEVMRDFLDVRDVIRAYITVIENYNDAEIFNVCKGEGVFISGIIGMLEDIAGFKIEMEMSGDLLRKNEITHAIGDNNKLKSTGWMPEYDMIDTLKWMMT